MVLKVLQWNIKGYLNNFSELQALIKTHKPQIISLQETHLKSDKNIPIPINYKLYISKLTANSFGGSALIVHNSIQHKQINSDNTFDTVALTIQSKLKFTIFSTYISPNTTFNKKNIEDTFGISTSPSLITGDFNSWHSSWGSIKNNKRGKIVNKFITQSNLILLNDGSPTHYSTHNTFSHIDLTIASPILKINSSWQVYDDLSGSDHFPIITSLFCNLATEFHSHKAHFILEKANWIKFHFLSSEFHKARPFSVNINKETANVQKIILQSANQSIPHYIPKRGNTSVPWWNRKLELLKKERNRLWNILKRHITNDNIINFKKANAKFKREVKISKRESIHKFTSEIQPGTSTGKLWSNIQRFCGLKTKSRIHCIQNISNPQTMLTNNTDIASAFAHFWSKESEDHNFPSLFRQSKLSVSIPTNLIPCKDALLIETPISMLEFTACLSKLKGKTPGIDNISYPMISNTSEPVRQRIVSLYNKIFTNYIPQIYKNSLIIPIIKPNSDKTDIKSYRPISLNSCVSKVLDKIISNRLWWFVTKKNLLNDKQLGFKNGKSTYDSLIYLDHIITQAIASKTHISLVSLDFAKAYDKIGIHTILDQLNQWKIGPNIFQYVRNYLTNRKLKVRANSVYSNTYPLNNGIPQGSPISVILFLIAYNKLCGLITLHKEISFISYADDFVIIKKQGKTKNQDIDIKPLLDDILSWCEYSGARLSVEKCKHLHICRKHNCKPQLLCGISRISTVESLKILGLTFNKQFRWNTHIDNIIPGLNNRLNIIKCLSNNKFNCNTISLLTAVHALIKSKIDYGLVLYGKAAKSLMNKINTIFNSAIRMALGAFRTTSINTMLFESNFMAVSNNKEFLTCKHFKNIFFKDKSPLSEITKRIVNSSRLKNIPSTLNSIINYCRIFDIPINNTKIQNNNFPPWHLRKSSINASLSNFKKKDTPTEIYRMKLLEIQDSLHNFTFIYTDGSKFGDRTAYSVVQQDKVEKCLILPEYSSNFTAEIIAIYDAMNLIQNGKSHIAIFTDSMASIESVNNICNNEYYASSIRQKLIKMRDKLLLIWIPGHAQIPGNEFADRVAKNATESPLIMSKNLNTSDIGKYFKSQFRSKQNTSWNSTSKWYQQVNKDRTNIINILKNNHSNNLSRRDQIVITRLRLGHTLITHKYIFDKNVINQCSFCNSRENNVDHIFTKCNFFRNQRNDIFPNNNVLEIFNNLTPENIKLILKYIKACNLYNLI